MRHDIFALLLYEPFPRAPHAFWPTKIQLVASLCHKPRFSLTLSDIEIYILFILWCYKVPMLASRFTIH